MFGICMFLVLPLLVLAGLVVGDKYSRLEALDSCMLFSCCMTCLSFFVTVMDPS